MGFKIPKGVSKIPMTIRVEETDFEIIERIAKGKIIIDIIITFIFSFGFIEKSIIYTSNFFIFFCFKI